MPNKGSWSSFMNNVTRDKRGREGVNFGDASATLERGRRPRTKRDVTLIYCVCSMTCAAYVFKKGTLCYEKTRIMYFAIKNTGFWLEFDETAQRGCDEAFYCQQIYIEILFKTHFLLKVGVFRILSAFVKWSCSTRKPIARIAVTLAFEIIVKI